MKIVAECPGMCSDCPGTSTKVLPLEMFFHVLERESYGFWMRRVRFGGGVRGTPIISQVWPTPPICPSADRPHFPGGPSTFGKILSTPDYNCHCSIFLTNGGPSMDLWRTIRDLLSRQPIGVSEACRLNR